MKYFKNNQGRVFAYAADGSQDMFILDGLSAISEAEADAIRFPAPTMEQLFAAGEAAAQENLDGVAWSWGYGDRPGPGCFDRAVTYASSGVPRYKAEAMALIGWRDSYWPAAYLVKKSIMDGKTPMPATPADFVAMLPSAPVKPV